ncbi:MAG: sulfur carrier protein ThiS [Lachnospiraceae bacterium]|nr:sulfur carrier protein ThiS [Lachnospiraceae bacterium]
MRVNDEQISLDGTMPVVELLQMKGYPLTRIAVEVNGQIVPKAKYETYELHDEDTVEIVCFVGGG